MDQEIDEAMRKSVMAFYDGKDFEESGKVSKVKYNKSFFDDFEEEMSGKKRKSGRGDKAVDIEGGEDRINEVLTPSTKKAK